MNTDLLRPAPHAVDENGAANIDLCRRGGAPRAKNADRGQDTLLAEHDALPSRGVCRVLACSRYAMRSTVLPSGAAPGVTKLRSRANTRGAPSGCEAVPF